MDLISFFLFLNSILGFSYGKEDLEREDVEYRTWPFHEDIYPPELDHFPKNIVLFVASGMSVEAVVKTEFEIKKKMSLEQEEDTRSSLPLDFVPNRGKLQTYGVDFKPGNLESGLNNIFYGSTEKGSCERTNKDPLNIVSLAQKVGKHTGFITNLNVLSEVKPAFFGHENCYDARKFPSCHLQNAKLNVIFGQRRDDEDPTQEGQASNKHCSLIDEETFVKKWQKEGFHRILFNSSDVNDNLTAYGNVLGLFPNISKENFMAVINQTMKLLTSNEKGYFLVVYLKYPDVLKTLDLTMELFRFIHTISSGDETLNILTSEYACEGDCIKKYTTDKKYDERKDQETTGNSSLPTQKELEKEKDRVEALKQKENPDGSEGTVKNAAEDHTKEPEEENSQVHLQNTVIQEDLSKESPKLTGNTTEAGSLEKRQELNTTSKEEVKSTFGESIMTMELTTKPPVLPINSTIQTKPPENVEGGREMEHPQTSAAIDANYSSKILINPEEPASKNLNQQLEDSKAGTFENEDQLKPTSNPLNNPSDSGSMSSFVDNLENKTSTEPSSRRRRELEPKISPDVPIYASGPLGVVFDGINKQNYLWIFMKMSFCADGKFDGLRKCKDDPVLNKYYDALFVNKAIKDSIANSSAYGIFGKYLFAYLILACVSFYAFYF